MPVVLTYPTNGHFAADWAVVEFLVLAIAFGLLWWIAVSLARIASKMPDPPPKPRPSHWTDPIEERRRNAGPPPPSASDRVEWPPQ